MQWLDYVAIVVYLAITLFIAWRATRKQDNAEDFFLGGRQMPWFAVGLSIMATLLSTNTYLGAPGEMIKYGPAYFIGFLAYPLVVLVVVGVWIPFFMRLRMTSAYEYLERRYDYRARILGSVLFLGLRLGWMAMVVYTASKAIVTMVPGPLTWLATQLYATHPIYPVIAAIGVAATIYACVGGIRAVIWTDVVQAVMLFGGVGAIILFVAWSEGSGPLAWWQSVTSAAQQPTRVVWFTADIAERTTVAWALIAILAWNTCTHCCDQVALQRYFATTSLPAARRSFIVNIVSSALIGLLLALSGLALRFYYLRHSNQLPEGITPASGAEELMPHFFVYQLPMGFGGLILVSFICDAMQTLGSGVNSIAAVVTRDRRQHGHGSHNEPVELAEPAAAELSETTPHTPIEISKGEREVRSAKLATLGVGALSTALAIGAAAYALASGKTIFDMLPRMFNMFLGPLASLFIIGMFYRRATAGVALVVVLIVQFFSIVWSWWGEVPVVLSKVGLESPAAWWIGILGRDAAGQPRIPSVMLAIAVPALAGLALGWLGSRLCGRDDHPGVLYTRAEVMKRPPIHVQD